MNLLVPRRLVPWLPLRVRAALGVLSGLALAMASVVYTHPRGLWADLPVIAGGSALLGAAIAAFAQLVREAFRRRVASDAILVAAWCTLVGSVAAMGGGFLDALGGRAHRLAVAGVCASYGGALALALLEWRSIRSERAALPGRALRSAMPGLCGLCVAVASAVLLDQPLFRYYPAVVAIIVGYTTWSVICCAGYGLQLDAEPARRLARAAPWLLGSMLACLTAGWLSPGRTLDSVPSAGVAVRVFAPATDFDLDGYPAYGRIDCEPFDAAVNPGSEELAGNGKDDNCRFGDADPRRAEVTRGAAPAARAKAVVLVTVDTVRADFTGAVKGSASATPSLDRWAQSARTFESAYTAAPRTCLSVRSILTGAWPQAARWRNPERTEGGRRLAAHYGSLVRWPWQCIADEPVAAHDSTWLAVRLREAGIRTAAIVNDGGALVLRRELFGAGFDDYVDDHSREDAEIAALAARRLRELADGPPFFLWVHLFGAHQERDPAAGVAPEVAYRDAVRRADGALSGLLSALDAIPESRDWGVIIASDHGEEYGVLGRSHGSTLSDDVLRIPLVLRAPGVLPGRSSSPVSTVDIAPTVAALLGVPADSAMDGVSLDRVESDPERVLLADTFVQDRAYTMAVRGGSRVRYDHGLDLFDQIATGSDDVAAHGALRAYLKRHDVTWPPR